MWELLSVCSSLAVNSLQKYLPVTLWPAGTQFSSNLSPHLLGSCHTHQAQSWPRGRRSAEVANIMLMLKTQGLTHPDISSVLVITPLNVYMDVFFFFCKGFSQYWYNQAFLKVCGDLTLAFGFEHRAWKGRGTTWERQENLRRFYAGVSDSDFIVFFPRLVCQSFPVTEMISQASNVFVWTAAVGAVLLGVADGDNVALWQELTTTGSAAVACSTSGRKREGGTGWDCRLLVR